MLTASILTFLNPEKVGFEPLILVRCAWNALFGVIMILLQPKWASYGGSCTTWVHTRFGFLTSWFGKAMFFLFVGTNIMEPESPSAGTAILSIVAGCACLFVGFVELLFGFKCADSSQGGTAAGGDKNWDAEPAKPQTSADGPSGPSWSQQGGSQGVGGPPGPSLTINITPSQAVKGAKLAAKAGKVADGAGGANPFCGNAHLKKAVSGDL